MCCGFLAEDVGFSTAKARRVSSSSLKSLRLAPATESATGTPPPSTSKERLAPILPRSTGLGPVFSPRQRRFRDRPIHAQPLPVDASERIVRSQTRLPETQEKAVGHP